MIGVRAIFKWVKGKMGSENKDKQHRSFCCCFVFKDLKLKGKIPLERNKDLRQGRSLS